MSQTLPGPPTSRRRQNPRRITQEEIQAYHLCVQASQRYIRAWLGMRKQFLARIEAGAQVQPGRLSLKLDGGDVPTEAELTQTLAELEASQRGKPATGAPGKPARRK